MLILINVTAFKNTQNEKSYKTNTNNSVNGQTFGKRHANCRVLLSVFDRFKRNFRNLYKIQC